MAALVVGTLCSARSCSSRSDSPEVISVLLAARTLSSEGAAVFVDRLQSVGLTGLPRMVNAAALVAIAVLGLV